MIDAYTRCNVCEMSPAECLYDGEPMCYDCRAATAKVKREYPELSEKEPCIGCGADVCEDLLCKQDAWEAYCLNRVAPLGGEDY